MPKFTVAPGWQSCVGRQASDLSISHLIAPSWTRLSYASPRSSPTSVGHRTWSTR
jgi:hypothetical protein